MEKVKVDGLAKAIAAELAAYDQEVTDGLKKEVRQVAKEMVTQLKQTSPRDSGEYASGWKAKVEYESAQDIRERVYNAKKTSLTHILENGHAKVNGGRVEGTPHIGPAEQQAADKLENKAKVVARG